MPVRVTVLVGPAVDDLTNPHATRPHTRRYGRDDDDDGYRVADVIHAKYGEHAVFDGPKGGARVVQKC